MSNETKLKILVATHKPCMLPNESIYFPIHCGRAVTQLNSDLQDWMIEHTQGDDTGDNISELNPYFCELTAIYWAWKNYERLGSPQKIGLCHYRRYFMDFDANSAITAPVHILSKSVAEQFDVNHNPYELQKAINLIEDSEFKNSTMEYLNQKKGYFFNMFILQKEYFFEYCNMLFPLLFRLSENSNWNRLDSYQKRMPGFIAERLTGAYLYHLKMKKNISLHETLPIVPITNTYSILKHQIAITNYLAKTIPQFPRLYAKFLSLQTHVLKH